MERVFEKLTHDNLKVRIEGIRLFEGALALESDPTAAGVRLGDILFGPNIHPEILRRSSAAMKQLIRQQALDVSVIEKLAGVIIDDGKHPNIIRASTALLEQLIPSLTGELMERIYASKLPLSLRKEAILQLLDNSADYYATFYETAMDLLLEGGHFHLMKPYFIEHGYADEEVYRTCFERLYQVGSKKSLKLLLQLLQKDHRLYQYNPSSAIQHIARSPDAIATQGVKLLRLLVRYEKGLSIADIDALLERPDEELSVLFQVLEEAIDFLPLPLCTHLFEHVFTLERVMRNISAVGVDVMYQCFLQIGIDQGSMKVIEKKVYMVRQMSEEAVFWRLWEYCPYDTLCTASRSWNEIMGPEMRISDRIMVAYNEIRRDYLAACLEKLPKWRALYCVKTFCAFYESQHERHQPIYTKPKEATFALSHYQPYPSQFTVSLEEVGNWKSLILVLSLKLCCQECEITVRGPQGTAYKQGAFVDVQAEGRVDDGTGVAGYVTEVEVVDCGEVLQMTPFDRRRYAHCIGMTPREILRNSPSLIAQVIKDLDDDTLIPEGTQQTIARLALHILEDITPPCARMDALDGLFASESDPTVLMEWCAALREMSSGRVEYEFYLVQILFSNHPTYYETLVAHGEVLGNLWQVGLEMAQQRKNNGARCVLSFVEKCAIEMDMGRGSILVGIDEEALLEASFTALGDIEDETILLIIYDVLLVLLANLCSPSFATTVIHSEAMIGALFKQVVHCNSQEARAEAGRVIVSLYSLPQDGVTCDSLQPFFTAFPAGLQTHGKHLKSVWGQVLTLAVRYWREKGVLDEEGNRYCKMTFAVVKVAAMGKVKSMVLFTGVLQLLHQLLATDFEMENALQSDMIRFLMEDVLFSRRPFVKDRGRRKDMFSLVKLLGSRSMRGAVQLALVVEKLHLKSPLVHYDYIRSYAVPKETGPMGLENMGCTCYLNAVVQLLFDLASFRKAILALPYDPHPNEPSNVLIELQRVFARMQLSERAFITPSSLVSVMRDMDGNPLDPGVQMDADEFFNVLCDALERELKPLQQEGIMKELWEGKVCSQVICRSCPNRTEPTQTFFSLALDIKHKSSITESLDLFVSGEVLEGDNAYSCEPCEVKVTALKRDCLKRLPSILLLNLKRLDFDFFIMERVKLDHYLSFPMELDMLPYTAEGLAAREGDTQGELVVDPSHYQYELRGLILHQGTADSGHYFALLRQGKTAQWLELNDADISPFDMEKFEKVCFGSRDGRFGSPSAYMLVYERKGDDASRKGCSVEEITAAMNERLRKEVELDNDIFHFQRFLYDEVYLDALRAAFATQKQVVAGTAIKLAIMVAAKKSEHHLAMWLNQFMGSPREAKFLLSALTQDGCRALLQLWPYGVVDILKRYGMIALSKMKESDMGEIITPIVAAIRDPHMILYGDRWTFFWEFLSYPLEKSSAFRQKVLRGGLAQAIAELYIRHCEEDTTVVQWSSPMFIFSMIFAEFGVSDSAVVHAAAKGHPIPKKEPIGEEVPCPDVFVRDLFRSGFFQRVLLDGRIEMVNIDEVLEMISWGNPSYSCTMIDVLIQALEANKPKRYRDILVVTGNLLRLEDGVGELRVKYCIRSLIDLARRNETNQHLVAFYIHFIYSTLYTENEVVQRYLHSEDPALEWPLLWMRSEDVTFALPPAILQRVAEVDCSSQSPSTSEE